MPIQAWAAYEAHHDMFGFGAITGNGSWQAAGGNADSSSDYGFQLGVGYTFGDIFAYVNFEMLKYKDDVTAAGGGGDASYKRNAFSIGAKWNVATGYVGGQFIKAMDGSCSGNMAGLIPGCTDVGLRQLGCLHGCVWGTTTPCPSRPRPTSWAATPTTTTCSSTQPPVVPLCAVNLGATVWGVTVGLKHSF